MNKYPPYIWVDTMRAIIADNDIDATMSDVELIATVSSELSPVERGIHIWIKFVLLRRRDIEGLINTMKAADTDPRTVATLQYLRRQRPIIDIEGFHTSPDITQHISTHDPADTLTRFHFAYIYFEEIDQHGLNERDIVDSTRLAVFFAMNGHESVRSVVTQTLCHKAHMRTQHLAIAQIVRESSETKTID